MLADNEFICFRIMRRHMKNDPVEWAILSEIDQALQFILVTSKDYMIPITDFYIEVI